MMQDIILFGTGDRGKKVFRFLDEIGKKILFWIDSDSGKWNTELFRVPIYKPEKVLEYEDSIICIAAIDPEREMYHKLCSYGISPERIYSFTEMIIKSSKEVLKSDLVDTRRRCPNPDILFDCTNGLGLGGVEVFSMQLAEELESHGKHAFLVAPQGDKIRNSNSKTKILYTKINATDGFSLQNIKNIMKSVEEKMPCTVITSCMNDFFLAVCILKECYPTRIKIISVVHQGLLASYKEHADVMQYVERYIGVSRDISEGLCLQGIKEDIISHMTCPVACRDVLDRTYTEDTSLPIRIGYAGRLEVVQKRLDLLPLLIDALNQLKTNYMLEIAGTGSYYDNILEYVHSMGLENRIHLLGTMERSKMPDFWNRQDICINLSDYEGRSISIMEAMANGAVPIVTKTSGVREDIIDGENGYLINIGDYSKMANIIDALEKQRYLLKNMGQKAFLVISSKCRMKDHIIFWNQVLGELW